MKALLLRLGNAAGIDSAIINVVTARLWSLLAGPLSIFLIAHRLSPQEQGFYYTFNSVMGATVFLELGLIYVVLQFAAHEMVGLRWEGERVEGEAMNRARLGDLLRKSVRWYSVASTLVLALLLPAGFWFLGRDAASAGTVTWKGPWLFVGIASACSMSISPVTAVIEGCGRVAEVTRVRMWEGMAMSITLWTGLLSGCRLYSASMALSASFLVTFVWLATTKRHFVIDLFFRHHGSTLSWWKEIAPLQWRTAVVWISGYFAYQFFTPAVFASHGAALAGRLGMTLYLINVVVTVSLAWMQTKAAPFGQLVANRNWTELDTLYRRTLWQAVGMYLLGSVGLIGAIELLGWLQHPIAARFLDLPTALIFMIASGFNQVVFCRSVYLRAYKAEPYYVLQLANGIVVGAILLLLVPRVNLSSLALAYLLCACLPVMLISGVIFRKYQRTARTECCPA
jgi:hypothetical protein